MLRPILILWIAYPVTLMPVIFCSSARAGEVSETSKNYVAVGFAKNSKENSARQDACRDARRTLVGSVFGESVEFNQSMVRTSGAVDFSEDAKISSDRVQLIGWSQELMILDSEITCRITYPKSEAVIERDRLKGLRRRSEITYTQTEDSKGDKSGFLTIQTFPSDATVFIDNERWGTTPLKLENKLHPGARVLRIEHTNFEPIEETINLHPGLRVQVSRNLKRATAQLKIETAPEGAEIIVNGEDWGRSPTEARLVLAGQNLSIEARHDQADISTRSLTLSRNEQRALKLRLPLKPAYVSVKVVPADNVELKIDGKPIAMKSKIEITPGPHRLTVYSSGHHEVSRSFFAEGNKTTVLKTIELRKLSEAEIESLKERENSSRSLLVVGAGLQYFGATTQAVETGTVGYQLNVEYWFSSHLAISGSLAASEGSASYRNGDVELSQRRFSLSAPLILWTQSNRWTRPGTVMMGRRVQREDHLLLVPEWSQVTTSFKGSASESVHREARQSSVGGWLKWRQWNYQPEGQAGGIGLSYSLGFTKNFDSANGMAGDFSPLLGVELCIGF